MAGFGGSDILYGFTILLDDQAISIIRCQAAKTAAIPTSWRIHRRVQKLALWIECVIDGSDTALVWG